MAVKGDGSVTVFSSSICSVLSPPVPCIYENSFTMSGVVFYGSTCSAHHVSP
jgi:hypothetical protein